MAILIPSDRRNEEFNGSIGESQLYESFKKLSDDYIIFHSVRWMKSINKARFGESDYIIFHKKHGIICLEVKHGGVVGENGRILQINRRTKERFEIDPIGQANRSKYYFIDILTPIFKRYKFSIPIHSVVWFTGIDKIDVRGTLPHDYDVNGNTFFYDDIVNIPDVFKKCFSFFKMDKQNIPKSIVNKIRNAILPEFEVFPGMANIVNQNEYVFNRMTKEQSYLLDYLEEQKIAAIEGGAGTGKTILAIEKVKRLSNKEKVVFLCFNSLLMENLREKYGDELPNVTFTNIHSLTAKALKKNISDEDILMFLNNYNEYPNVWDFDSIVVDEGQDFTNEQIELLREISILNNGSFYVFYDKNQLVQQRIELEWLHKMECRLILSYNCRNTHSIAKTSSNPLGIKEVKMRFDIRGDLPLYHNTSSKKNLLNWLYKRINFYTSDNIDLNQIVILTTKTIESSILNNIKKIGKYSISHTVNEDAILFTTARKFKGLEADVILLVDIDAEQFNREEAKRVFYVATSRAKSFLEIIPTLSDEEEQKMFYNLSGGKSKRNMTLIKNLNVKPI